MLAIEEKRTTDVQRQTTLPEPSCRSRFVFALFFTEFQMSWKRPQFAVMHMLAEKMQKFSMLELVGHLSNVLLMNLNCFLKSSTVSIESGMTTVLSPSAVA